MNKNRERAKHLWNWSKDNLNIDKTPCGPFAAPEASARAREYLEKVVRELNIKTISDAGCGEFGLWMRHTNLGDAKYTGYDINDDVIKKNRMEFPGIKFEELNIVNTVLPKTDLIICRDCLYHLPINIVQKTINNFTESGSKYLLATNHNHLIKNTEVPKAYDGYGYRELNIIISPFNFSNPISFVDERMGNRQFCLWKLS